MTIQGTPATGRYAEAGVDIDAGTRLVERDQARGRGDRAAPASMGGLGGFGGAVRSRRLRASRDPVLVATTDGVGTKVALAIDTGRHARVGIDLVAMCVNDLVVPGRRSRCSSSTTSPPAGSMPAAAGEVVAGHRRGLPLAGCALIGGETAEMPGMYGRGEFDLAGFAVGAVERDARAAAPRRSPTATSCSGLASSGVHANGYSLVRRRAARAGPRLATPAPSRRQPLGDALLAPTRIYVRACLAAIAAGGSRRWRTSPAAG